MIKQYIYRNRNGQRQKVGLFFGTTIKNQIVIGFSLCSREDKFDRDKALAIAVGRALSPKSQECPPSISDEACDFADRCVKYFKDSRIFYANEVN